MLRAQGTWEELGARKAELVNTVKAQRPRITGGEHGGVEPVRSWRGSRAAQCSRELMGQIRC